MGEKLQKRVTRSRAFYVRALQGYTDKKTGDRTLGLRETAPGFDSAHGYNLNKIDKLSAAKKKRIEAYWHELQNLTAQPRYILREKDKKKLKQAQQVVQGDDKFKWDVAFIPYTPPVLKSGKLSKAKPRISFTKSGVRIRSPRFARIFVALNQRALVRDAEGEVNKAIRENADKATRFTIQAGENEISTMYSRGNIAQRVIKLMLAYDGKKALPRSSGNRLDKPEDHHYSKWLTGIQAYEFPRTTEKIVKETGNTWNDARIALQRKRGNYAKQMKRDKVITVEWVKDAPKKRKKASKK